MLVNKSESTRISKELVRVANPEFFSATMLSFIGHTEEDWSVGEYKGKTCVFVNRPNAGAIACYSVNPITYQLKFWCHIADRLTP